MSEVRVDLDREHAYRVLLGFGRDERPALLSAGNNAGAGGRWYDMNVPIADERFDDYLTALRGLREGPR